MSRLLDKAIAVHHTATTDDAWDGPAAVASMPNSADALKYCHAWVDPAGDPDAKASYKFPHHKADHAPANLAACRNGLSRLSGANIPEGDKNAVKSHLQGHLDDAQTGNRLSRLRNLHQSPGDGSWFRIMIDGKRVDNAYMAGNAEIYLYDEIGMWGVSAGDFVQQLKQLGNAALDLHINSPGGDVFDGIAIYNAILAHPGPVNVLIDGLAASAASFIAMAGKTVQIAKTGTMMIHDALGMTIGNAADMREMADLLDKSSDNIAGIYADKASGSVPDWRARMQAETWYSSDEAVDAGLCDQISVPASQQAAPDVLTNRVWPQMFRYVNRQSAPAPVPVVPEPAPPGLGAILRDKLKGAGS